MGFRLIGVGRSLAPIIHVHVPVQVTHQARPSSSWPRRWGRRPRESGHNNSSFYLLPCKGHTCADIRVRTYMSVHLLSALLPLWHCLSGADVAAACRGLLIQTPAVPSPLPPLPLTPRNRKSTFLDSTIASASLLIITFQEGHEVDDGA